MLAYGPSSGIVVGLRSSLQISLFVLIFFRLGSSGGRGTRAAGWFRDLLDDREISGITSAILLGGIKGWAQAGEEYTSLMDEYVAQAWLNAT